MTPRLRIHITVDGEPQGTFSRKELHELWEAGELKGDVQFWYPGRMSWAPVAEFTAPAPDYDPTPAWSVELATVDTIAGREIVDHLALVHADAVTGVSLVSEVLANVTDLIGGQSRRLEKLVAEARKRCFDTLREKTSRLQGHAVVGVAQDVHQISGKGMLLLVVTAAGTAVRLKEKPPPVEQRADK